LKVKDRMLLFVWQEEITSGGKLTFEMAEEPVYLTYGEADLPYSLSR